jgi:hypothetical protein
MAINSALHDFQWALLSPSMSTPDITIDLSFIGGGTVTFLRASDFMQGGQFYTAVEFAKAIVSVFLVWFWLNAFRKKYLIMMEIAGYGG